MAMKTSGICPGCGLRYFHAKLDVKQGRMDGNYCANCQGSGPSRQDKKHFAQEGSDVIKGGKKKKDKRSHEPESGDVISEDDGGFI